MSDLTAQAKRLGLHGANLHAIYDMVEYLQDALTELINVFQPYADNYQTHNAIASARKALIHNAKSQATDAALSRQVACTDGLEGGG